MKGKVTRSITLDQFFAAAGAIGLLSAQLEEPDPEWASDWALDFGELMAKKAHERASAKPSGDEGDTDRTSGDN